MPIMSQQNFRTEALNPKLVLHEILLIDYRVRRNNKYYKFQQNTIKTLSLQVSIITASFLPPELLQARSVASDDSLEQAVSYLQGGVLVVVGSDRRRGGKPTWQQKNAVQPAAATLQPLRSRTSRYAQSLHDPPPDAALDADCRTMCSLFLIVRKVYSRDG